MHKIKIIILMVFLMNTISVHTMRRLWNIPSKKAPVYAIPYLPSIKKDLSQDLVQIKEPEIKQPLFGPFSNTFKAYREQPLWNTIKSVAPSLTLTVFSLVTGIPITVINLDSLKKPFDYAASWFKAGK